MTDTDAGAAAAQDNLAEAPASGIRVLAQFIRDLSFENPKAPESLRQGAEQPQIDVGVELNARGREDGLFEIDLKLNVTAARQADTVFAVELVYGGLFQIVGVPDDQMEPVLMIECPRFLFPFARAIISSLTAESGFPPFMLEPLDFAGIYAARAQQMQSQPTGNA